MTLEWQCVANRRGVLDFVRRGDTGAVHVIVQEGSSSEPNPEFAERWERATRRRTEALGHPMLAAEVLAFSPVLTLCGQVIYTGPVHDGQITDCFDDNDLCRSCHRALGDQADSAFEHRQPGRSGGARRLRGRPAVSTRSRDAHLHSRASGEQPR